MSRKLTLNPGAQTAFVEGEEKFSAYSALPDTNLLGEQKPRMGGFKTRREYQLVYNRWYRKTARGAEKHRDFERRRAAQKLAVLSAWKTAAGCADCGYSAHPEALDFDHVADNKVMGVSRMVSSHMRLEDILAEAEKCEVVCANCHRVRTAERRAPGA